jgi:hypothetical protein
MFRIQSLIGRSPGSSDRATAGSSLNTSNMLASEIRLVSLWPKADIEPVENRGALMRKVTLHRALYRRLTCGLETFAIR